LKIISKKIDDFNYFCTYHLNKSTNQQINKSTNQQINNTMKPLVSIIMGSTSDMPVMEGAAKFFDELEIPFEINALSAHRTPERVMEFAENAHKRGVRVIIAAAGGAAHLPGVIAASTVLPVIGVPINSSISIDGWDSILSILQMPAGIPVATVALDGSRNAAILATQILALSDESINTRLLKFKSDLKSKVEKANKDLQNVTFKFRVV
jgi:5-(carboxyamino)imidazole ribonucleotide mutase